MIKTAFILFGIATTVYAQAPDTAWTRIYQTGSHEFANCIAEASEGGYVICGYKRSPSWDTDVYLMKTDVNGQIQWTRTYGGPDDDSGIKVKPTPDNGFIIVGYTSSFGSGYNDIYLIKTDQFGDTLWTNTYGGDSSDVGRSVFLTSDGGYLVSGQTYLFGPGEFDAILIKTDSLGQEIWTGTFGGLAGEVDDGYAAIKTGDGGYMMVARKGAFGPDPEDIWLIKTDANGDSLWSMTYGDDFVERGLSLIPTLSGGYFIAGFAYSFQTASYDLYSLILDENANVLHSNMYGGLDTDLGVCGKQLFDGGFIIAGYTRSFSQGENDAYLVRTDQSGNLIWQFTFGGEEIDLASSCIQSTDGGYLITGYTYSFGVSSDIFLIKLDPEIAGTDDRVEGMIPENTALMANFPNPFNSSTIISFTLSEPGAAKLSVYSIQGQRVVELVRGIREAGEHSIDWDASDYPSGVYFARLVAGGASTTKKMLLLK